MNTWLLLIAFGIVFLINLINVALFNVQWINRKALYGNTIFWMVIFVATFYSTLIVSIQNLFFT